MVVSVLVLYPHDGTAHWLLRFAPTAQHRKRALYRILLAQENQNSEFEVGFLLNAYCFCPIVKSNNFQSSHRESGTFGVRIIFIIIVNYPSKPAPPPTFQCFLVFTL